MLKEEVVPLRRHPDIYDPQLIGACRASLVTSGGAPLVIPALNRDGDVSTSSCLFGSIAGAESLLVAFDDDYVPDAVMAEAAHRTAPALQGRHRQSDGDDPGRGVALGYGTEEAQRAGRAILKSCLEAVADGVRTADLGGHAATDEFTDDVIRQAEARGLSGEKHRARPHGFRSARRRPTPREGANGRPGQAGCRLLFELGQGAGDRVAADTAGSRDHADERVGDGDDPPAPIRRSLPRAAGWISASSHRSWWKRMWGGAGRRASTARINRAPASGWPLDLVEFVLVERAGLAEDGIVEVQLADVVQEAPSLSAPSRERFHPSLQATTSASRLTRSEWPLV